MKKKIKYMGRLTGWLMTGILMVFLLTGLLIQTRPVKNGLARLSEKQAAKIFDGTLEIGKIDGNFFSELVLEDVLLSVENDTLAFFEKFSANYRLFPLIRKKWIVRSAEIRKPRFFLEQDRDSSWNFQQLFKPTPGKKADTSRQSGPFDIHLSDFRIIDGAIETNTFDTIIPQHLRNWNTRLSLFWSANEQKAVLKECAFAAGNPDFTLNQLSFQLKRDDRFIELKDFRLKTAKNQLTGQAEHYPQPAPDGKATLQTGELNPGEFEFLFPHLKIPARPVIHMNARWEKNGARIHLELKENDQHIRIEASSPNFTGILFGEQAEEITYSLHAAFENMAPGQWLGDPELDYLLNGRLAVHGAGIDPANAKIDVSAALNESRVEGIRLSQLRTELELNQGNLSGMVRGKGAFGAFRIMSGIQNLFKTPDYHANIKASHLNLAVLTGNDSLSSDLNFRAGLKGRGISPKSFSASGKILFSNSGIRNLQIDTLLADAVYQKGNLLIDSLWFKNKSAALLASGNYHMQERSDLKFTGTLENTDAFQKLLPGKNLKGSGKIRGRLTGLPDSLRLNTTIHLQKTQFEEIKSQQIDLNAHISLTSADTVFSIGGEANELAYAKNKTDTLRFSLEGSPDSIFVEVDMLRSKINLPSAPITVEHLKVAGGANLLPADTIFNVYTVATNIISGESRLDTVSARLTGTPDSMFMTAGLTGRAIHSQLKTGIVPGDRLKLRLTGWDVHYKNQHWALQDPPAIIEIDSINYGIDHFKFAADSPGSTPHILMQGIFPPDGREDFRLELANLPVEKFSEWMGIESPPTGSLDLNLNLGGTPDSPTISGNYQVKEASYKKYGFKKFTGNVLLKNNQLDFNTRIVPQDSGKLEMSGRWPLKLNLDTMGFQIDPKAPVEGKLVVESFPLTLLDSLIRTGDIAGTLEGEISLGGTIGSPRTTGALKLTGASAGFKNYGINYRNIRMNLHLNDNQVGLDTLFIQSNDGSLAGKGQVDLGPGLFKGDVRQSHMHLHFNKFNPVNHRRFNMQVNGDIRLEGNQEKLIYDGDLTIPRAEVYLPAVLRMMGQMDVPEIPQPLLVQEAEKMHLVRDSLDTRDMELPKPDNLKLKAPDLLQGKIRIRIPKNTWIKNRDMRMELSGDLELRKNKEYFELFGTVEVVRGQYDLLGKTFIIKEGSITFQGGEAMTPQMNITALYAFRNAQRVRQELSVTITGTPGSPDVRFRLDGNSVSEGDGLSYILFGKGMNELSLTEHENVTAGGENLAERAAASVLSSQIGDFLGKKLNVDYIEVKSDGGFSNASVVVGKYITNDLFVSYEQRFGEPDEKDVAKYDVQLEYELFRFLFFELNNSTNESGFDVIFKFDAK